MSTQLKIGIVGCGGIANGKHMPSLSRLPEVAMVAFCDIIPERAEAAAKKFGVEGATVYTDYKKMLEKEKLDVVHVCTPNVAHSPIACAALEAGCHVMCEKPMAINAVEAKKMLDTAKKTGKKLTIGYQNRYRKETLYLKSECESGTFGEIYFAKAHALRRRGVPLWGVFIEEELQGGGPLIDIGTHALDMTLWLMNNYKPAYCIGQAFHKLSKNGVNTGNNGGDWDPKKFTVEDSAFGMVVMESGATIYLESSWAINMTDTGEAACTICGTEGGAEMRGGLRLNGVRNGRQYVLTPNLEGGSNIAFFPGAGGMNDSQIEAAQWIDAIINDKQPCVLPEQAYCVSQILDGIYESAKTGKAVYFK